jgi:hypothetical protein
MDPATAAVIASLAAATKSLGEMIQSIGDGAKKSQLELVKTNLDLYKSQIELVVKERDALQGKVTELTKENSEIHERLAHHEMSTDYDVRHGLLFKKGKDEGPYCPVDRYHMTLKGQLSLRACPIYTVRPPRDNGTRRPTLTARAG